MLTLQFTVYLNGLLTVYVQIGHHDVSSNFII